MPTIACLPGLSRVFLALWWWECQEAGFWALSGARVRCALMSADQVERFEGLPRRSLADGCTVVEAATQRARRRGLSRLDSLPPDVALHIPNCPSVHTFGMRFPLDLIWLRKDGTVARVDRAVGSARMRACFRARSVVETLGGEADRFLTAGVGQTAAPG